MQVTLNRTFDQIKEEMRSILGLGTPQAPVRVNPPNTLPLEIVQEVIRWMSAGNKIEAIKLVRAHANLGLKEAKDYCDSLESYIPRRRSNS